MMRIPKDLPSTPFPSPLLLSSGIDHRQEGYQHQPARYARSGGEVAEEPASDTGSVCYGETMEVEEVGDDVDDGPEGEAPADDDVGGDVMVESRR